MANVKYHSAKVWAIAHPEIAVKIWNIWLEFISDFFYFLEALLSAVSWKLKLILPCEIETAKWKWNVAGDQKCTEIFLEFEKWRC